MLLTKEGIIDLVRRDSSMVAVLEAARACGLPDWMIGAGFLRNKVWDHLHGIRRNSIAAADIDLIYFDPHDLSKETEKAHDRRLGQRLNVNWSAKNQARMHIRNERPAPYRDTEEALGEWLETPTAVALRLEADGRLRLFAPHGIDDLVGLIVRPTPAGRQKPEAYRSRLAAKNWAASWPKLRYVDV